METEYNKLGIQNLATTISLTFVIRPAKMDQVGTNYASSYKL